MPLILEQNHLNKLVCSVCHKYLSVLPIKQYENGVVKCGRCCKTKDDGVVSISTYIAEHFLFKCVNSYSGCRKLLHVSDVFVHETDCLGETYTCHTCAQEICGSYQLIQHYKIQHAENVLNKNTLKLSITDDCLCTTSIYIIDNFLFFIFVSYCPASAKLNIKILSLKDYGEIFYKIKVGNDKSGMRETGNQTCLTLNSMTEKNESMTIFNFKPHQILTTQFFIDLSLAKYTLYEMHYRPTDLRGLKTKYGSKSIELTADFEKLYPDYKLSSSGTTLISIREATIDLLCVNCKRLMGSDVFYCARKFHLHCWDCRAWCAVCECPIAGRKADVSAMCEYILFPCRWKKCSQKNYGKEVRKHELSCYSRKKQCPECLNYLPLSALLDHLKKHFPRNESFVSEDFTFKKFLTFVENSGNRKASAYFLQNYKLISIHCEVHSVFKGKLKRQMIISNKPVEKIRKGELCVIIDAKERHNLINDVYVNMRSAVSIYVKFY